MDYAIDCYTWEAARQWVVDGNPELVQIIDKISPGDDFKLYRASYYYGDMVDDGQFSVRSDNGLQALAKIDRSNNFAKELMYSQGSIPAGIVLEGCMELFMDSGSKIMTKRIFKKGDAFALWRKMDGSKESLHPLYLMYLSAGVRSIFMLPNIGDHISHANFRREYNLNIAAPKNLLEHWRVFKALANQQPRGENWRLRLLLFFEKWFEKIHGDDPVWDSLRVYFYKKMWQKTAYWRNQVFYDYNFSLAQNRCNLKPNPYLMDTLKHLLAVMVSALPGFSANGNDDCAPISFIKKAYIECYQLKDYIPTILHPAYFDDDEENLFYSLQFPTTLVFSPKSNQANNLQQLRELQHLYSIIFNEFINRDFGMASTLFENVLK